MMDSMEQDAGARLEREHLRSSGGSSVGTYQTRIRDYGGVSVLTATLHCWPSSV